MAALHLLASQSTQLPRAPVAKVAPSSSSSSACASAHTSTTSSSSPPPAFVVANSPVYPYERETPHPLLSGALRRGKWTHEEEAYAATIIQYFLTGVLPIQYGTTLRGYIAQLLHCDPMRVSKKLIPGSVFVGVRIDPKIGRRSYYPCPTDTPGLEEHKQSAEAHLAQLRARFIESIEREELQEQGLAQPTPSSRIVSITRAPSPPKRKREDDDVTPQEPASRRPNLPSLTVLLRQNRLGAHAHERSSVQYLPLPLPLTSSYPHARPAYATHSDAAERYVAGTTPFYPSSSAPY